MSLTIAIALLSVVIGLVYFWIRRRFSFFDENGFLHEKPIFPFGNFKGVGTEFHVVYKVKELYNKFKGKAPAFGVYIATSPTYVITDLETVKNVLVRDFDNFHNRGLYFNKKDDPISSNLFTIEDGEWRKMRAKLTPTFTSGKMKMMFETVLSIANTMNEQLEKDSESGVVEMKETLSKFTTDVIGNVAFGLEMNSIQNPDAMFRKMGKKIFQVDANMQIKAFMLSSFKSLGRKLRMKFFPSDVTDFFINSVRETVDYRLNNNVQRNDVMDLLIKLLDDGKGEEGKITFHELAAQCFVFFFAGELLHNSYQFLYLINLRLVSFYGSIFGLIESFNL